MTSSNGNVFRVTGLCAGATDAELWCFLDLRLNKRLSKQSWGWWFETPSSSLWRHCNVLSMCPAPPQRQTRFLCQITWLIIGDRKRDQDNKIFRIDYHRIISSYFRQSFYNCIYNCFAWFSGQFISFRRHCLRLIEANKLWLLWCQILWSKPYWTNKDCIEN